jgi:hypothetical protein
MDFAEDVEPEMLHRIFWCPLGREAVPMPYAAVLQGEQHSSTGDVGKAHVVIGRVVVQVQVKNGGEDLLFQFLSYRSV